MSLTVYLGIDVGSVTTKLALVNEEGSYKDSAEKHWTFPCASPIVPQSES